MATSPATAAPWSRVKWTRAAQVLPLTGSEPGAIDPELPPAQAFAAARDDDPLATIRFMAQALARIDAAAWMLACLEHFGRPAEPERAAALKAVRRWVSSPSEEAKRLAWNAGDAIRFDGAEGAACLAIFLSGGGLAPAPLPADVPETPVNPAPGVFGQAVAGAVTLVAYAEGALPFPERAAALLDLAAEAAAGTIAPGAAPR